MVQRLLDAGAVLIGKTNMDQFATGLVGVRSPYGVPRNPFDERYIPGGSSSGSAVAVATGLASFALGTDTAGSGRVPAALVQCGGTQAHARHVEQSWHGTRLPQPRLRFRYGVDLRGRSDRGAGGGGFRSGRSFQPACASA